MLRRRNTSVFIWIEPSLVGRVPLGLQITERPPRGKRHGVLLERRWGCFHHGMKGLFQLSQGAHVNDGKRVEYSVVGFNSSRYFKVASEIDVNDQTLGASIKFVIDHINIFMVPCTISITYVMYWLLSIGILAFQYHYLPNISRYMNVLSIPIPLLVLQFKTLTTNIRTLHNNMISSTVT